MHLWRNARIFWFLRLITLILQSPDIAQHCRMRYNGHISQNVDVAKLSKWKNVSIRVICRVLHNSKCMLKLIGSPFSVRAFSLKKIILKSFRAFSFLEFCQIFHCGHFPLYDGHFLLGHFPFRAFSVLPIIQPESPTLGYLTIFWNRRIYW